VRARRSLEDAKIAYEDTEVRAPSDGIILGRRVEVGTVITSASRDVAGGAVLLRMAILDTVQVRALVDETDIGMVKPGSPVTIRVAAYPNRRFTGEVLRIGAEAVVQQNVTMFPVLVRIANKERLLRPGMNGEVEVDIGEVRGALAVPNAALRSRDEAAIAALALGLTEDALRRQLEGTMLSPDETGPNPIRGRTDRRRSPFGGDYVAFVARDGEPRAVAVKTGLTDFDYTVVVGGLAEGDSVYLLPTSGLLEDQQERQNRIREREAGPLARTPR